MSSIQPTALMLRCCATSLFEIAVCVEQELPNVTIPQEIEQALRDVCIRFIDTKHDIVHDLSERSPEARPTDTLARFDRMLAWAQDDQFAAQVVIQALRQTTGDAV